MLRCFLFLLLSASAFAQLANSPPVPQWLAAPEAGTTYTQSVKHEGKLLKAVLLTASDGAVEIVLDGKSIATIKAADLHQLDESRRSVERLLGTTATASQGERKTDSGSERSHREAQETRAAQHREARDRRGRCSHTRRH
jgi:hypothetical protein